MGQVAPGIAEGRRAPVLLLGGTYGTLSLARRFTRLGVPVHLSVSPGSPAAHTRRHERRFLVPRGASAAEFWSELLLGDDHPFLHGNVLFPCNDFALDFVARHHAELRARYLLDDALPELMLAMLNKRRTLELARSAGLGAPRFWHVGEEHELDRAAGEADYPVVVKPEQSHLFQQRFGGRKFFFAKDPDELRARVGDALAAGLPVMVCEFVPGPDTLGSSFYTYIDAEGRLLFRLTKAVLRRYPVNAGAGCYHITTWEPETARVGEDFLRAIGFRGFAHLDFKKDTRDGRLKLMECNSRITAAHETLLAAGLDASLVVYNHVLGLPLPRVDTYRRGVRLWFPVEDYYAFRELRGRGELTLAGWLRSLIHRMVVPDLNLMDPRPGWESFRPILRRRLERLTGRPATRV